MKTLNVPAIPLSKCENVFEKVQQMTRWATVADIDQVNWKTKFPKLLPVKVYVAHDEDKFFLLYRVQNESLRVVATHDFHPVWEDSCVEFFMRRPGDKQYYNFECNAHGVLLASKRETRDSAEKLSIEAMKSIVRHSFISQHYQAGEQFSDWWLYLEIPKACMGFSQEEPLSGQTITGNFYKCGDCTPQPHYLSWNPIDTPTPNFHVPQFFGTIHFE